MIHTLHIYLPVTVRMNNVIPSEETTDILYCEILDSDFQNLLPSNCVCV